MPSFEVVILEQLLILQVAELGLDSVELVPQSQIILIPLLNLENFCLQLTDQQIFLVGGEVDTVVVLKRKYFKLLSRTVTYS